MRELTTRDREAVRASSANNATAQGAAIPPAGRLLTAFEVAELVGCHEESVRRAYLCGQLKRQRFGVRSWRFHPAEVQDWIERGAPTRVS
jgi:excisionase family DNA binding protein